MVLFVGGMAVAHYRFGMPVFDNNTGLPIKPDELRSVFLLLGGGGLFFALIGLMLNWCVGETRRTEFWVKLGLTLIVCSIGIAVFQATAPDF